MSFFGPVSPPLLSEANALFFQRLLTRARSVTTFAFAQAGVQLLGFAVGILIIRSLPKTEYAYYTIANSMQTTINLLADIGISIGLVSLGGKVWQDDRRLGQLITTGLQLRRRLGFIAMIVITPVLLYMLQRNGASPGYAFTLLILVLLGAVMQLSVGVFSVVPRLRANLRLIQNVDLAGAVIRLALVGILVFVFLNAGIAVTIGLAAVAFQYVLLRRYVTKAIDLRATPDPDDRVALGRFVRNQTANAIFFCLQGQITIFLIAFLGARAASVAEVGALGRLAMIFTVLGNLIANVFVPAFAKCDGAQKLRWLYFGIIAAVTAFSGLVFLSALLFPQQFLLILGPNYAHLDQALLLMVGAAVISAIAGTLWSLNAARAWITGSWLYIPTTISTQIALIPFVDLTSVNGVLWFNLISLLPSLLLNMVLSWRGFHSTAAAAG